MNPTSFFTFNRTIANRISPVLAKTFLTPNQITTLVLLSGIFAAYLMAQGSHMSMLGGALFLHVSFILDNCDGQVARLKSLSSSFGMWYDYLADLGVDFCLWIGLALGSMAKYPSPLVLTVMLLAMLGSVINFIRVVHYRRRVPKPLTADVDQPLSSERSVGGPLDAALIMNHANKINHRTQHGKEHHG